MEKIISALYSIYILQLRELIEQETLNVESCESFDLNDISDNEEIWIMEVPNSVSI